MNVFDEADRLLSTGGPGSANDVTYTYDKVGNVETLIDAGGTSTYSYTKINKVEHVTDPDLGVTTYKYVSNHNDRLERVTLPNGARTEMTLDGSGRITQHINRLPNGSKFADLSYKWKNSSDKDTSLRQSVTDNLTSRRTDYAYDPANRLTDVTTSNLTIPPPNATNPTWNYSYDKAGNRTKAIYNSTATSYAYNAASQLCWSAATNITNPTCSSPPSGAVPASHDANGNMTAGGNLNAFTAMTYNPLDQTVANTPTGSTSTSQAYGGATQSLWLSSGTKTFSTAGNRGITNIADGPTNTSFTRDPSGRLLSMKNGPDRYYYFYDGRGSVNGLTDTTGTVVQTYTYDPYGKTIATLPGASLDQPFQWNGEYRATDRSYKIGQRWYDTNLGRWTQKDPIATEHPYAYANNDPINTVDPAGTFPWGDCLLPGDDGDNGCVGGEIAKDPVGYVDGAMKSKECVGSIVGGISGISGGVGLALAGSAVGAIGVGGMGAMALGYGAYRCWTDFNEDPYSY